MMAHSPEPATPLSSLSRMSVVEASTTSTVLGTSVTGYIAGRLAPLQCERGYNVRCLARFETKVRARLWVENDRVEIIVGPPECALDEKWFAGSP